MNQESTSNNHQEKVIQPISTSEEIEAAQVANKAEAAKIQIQSQMSSTSIPSSSTKASEPVTSPAKKSTRTLLLIVGSVAVVVAVGIGVFAYRKYLVPQSGDTSNSGGTNNFQTYSVSSMARQ